MLCCVLNQFSFEMSSEILFFLRSETDETQRQTHTIGNFVWLVSFEPLCWRHRWWLNKHHVLQKEILNYTIIGNEWCLFDFWQCVWWIFFSFLKMKQKKEQEPTTHCDRTKVTHVVSRQRRCREYHCMEPCSYALNVSLFVCVYVWPEIIDCSFVRLYVVW